MNDADLNQDLHDYFDSITPADSVRATKLVATAIAARRRRAARPSAWQSLWQSPWRKMAAVAAAVVVVAALVVAPFAFRHEVGPTASSSLSAAATASPTAAATASPIAPAITASPSQGPTWKLLAANSDVWASWSPDGKWLAVSDSVAAVEMIPDQHLRLLDTAGNLIRALDGDRFTWLDATRFVLTRGTSDFLGSVDSNDLAPVSMRSKGALLAKDPLSNGHGAVAVPLLHGSLDKTDFTVWTPSGTSRVISGEPAAWSPDGSRLAVLHTSGKPVQNGIEYASVRLEILRWPDLGSQSSTTDLPFFGPSVTFDPSGRFMVMSEGGAAGYANTIVDAGTGQIVVPDGVSAAETPSAPAWDGAGNLLVPYVDGSVTSYSTSGGSSSTRTSSGDRVNSAANGATIVMYFWQDQRPITVIRGGLTRSIAAPGGLPDVVALSPLGGVVMSCFDDGSPNGGSKLMLLVG